MKFNLFLAEATGHVWVLFIIDGETIHADTATKYVEVFSTEQKMLDSIYDLFEYSGFMMPEEEAKKIKTFKQLTAFIKKTEGIAQYEEILFAKQVKVDASTGAEWRRPSNSVSKKQ